MKQREHDSAQKSKEGCTRKPDLINPIPSWGREKKRRKSGDKGAYENDCEQHAVIDLAGSDSGCSGSESDLNETQCRNVIQLIQVQHVILVMQV